MKIMKKLFSQLFEKIKKWFLKTALPWLKSSWMQIVNIIIVFISYGSLDSAPGAQAIVGFWLFILLGYYIFWKLFGAEFMFKKKDEISALPTKPGLPAGKLYYIDSTPVKPAEKLDEKPIEKPIENPIIDKPDLQPGMGTAKPPRASKKNNKDKE